MKDQKKPSRIKKWFLAIGIAIIFAMFVNYGIATFFDRPDYNKFCPQPNQTVINWTKDSCVTAGGQWTISQPAAEKMAPIATPATTETGYCNPDFTCSKAYDEAQQKYDGASFIITVIAGLVGLALGVMISVESLSAGFLLGGVLNIFIATIRYWDRFNDWMRFTLLGVVLIILIWIAYKKIR